MTDTPLIEKQGNIAVVTMNNPPANTWTENSLTALPKLIDDLENDKEIYALVLKSDSEKFFSAGADLNVFEDGDMRKAQTMCNLFGKAFERLSSFRGVSIAAINGWAMGGGLEVALACDIRIAEEQAQMALPEAKVGLLPCAGGTQNLTMLVGEGWAKKMILCGERVKAPKALEIGLVEEVVGTGEAVNRAIELAKQACEQAPVAVAKCKQLIQSHRTMPYDHGYMLERELFLELFHTEDQKEGVQAFLEKRDPNWKNA